MTTTVDLDSFPVLGKGNKFEDFTPGQVLEHHWGRTLTEGDNAVFSTGTCTWVPMYLNSEFARAHGHRDVVINPLLVLSTAVGLSVEDLSEGGGPFLGMEECTFHQPVYPGDTLQARSEVLHTRTSDSRSGVGIVTWRTKTFNQHGELVLAYVRSNFVAMRGKA
ncbi:MaoC family dehydratase [Streptomyces sp. NPDC055078]